MKHIAVQKTAIACAVVAACASILDAPTSFAQKADSRPLATRWQLDYNGQVEVGVGYVTDDNFQFGKYNGLYEDEVTLIGNLDWSGSKGNSFWNLSGSDLGLDTREGRAEWRSDGWNLFFELDSQKQVGNDSGRTPFRGGETLSLPADWVSAQTTAGFTALDASLRGFDQELERDIYTLGGAYQLNSSWGFEGSVRYEEREGNNDLGAAIAPNAAAGEAVILPQSIDYDSTEFDFAVNYQANKLSMVGSLFYSDFDNNDDSLLWQNPYSSFGPDIAWPAGIGGISQAPDNEFYQGRLTGTYLFSPSLRLQVDGSYSKTEQDQNFEDFTVNSLLGATVPLPRSNLDGETETKVLDTRVFWRPQFWAALSKLRLEGWFHGEERDFDLPRDGYQYVMADANPLEPLNQLYNTANDYSINRAGVEGSYPLPLRSRLRLSYEYEEYERDNSAVEKSEEDRYRLRYRLPLPFNMSMRLEALYGDRAADKYNWDQSYYARRDAERINLTPDNQRYDNHPLLSQYHIATRERTEMKLDLAWQPNTAWNVSLNMLYREDDYHKTELGLTDDELNQVNLTSSWVASDKLVLAAYGSYGDNKSQQSGRSFRGGIEKNAFEVDPPLPQASDPARDWQVDMEDKVWTLGLNAQWTPRDDLSLSADYNYVDAKTDYDFSDGGGDGLSSQPLPADDDSQQHHFILEGAWHYREDLSFKLNYQYWNYDSEDWATNGVSQNSIDKVLTLGEKEADEDLHYIGTSIIYRWQ
ncbi:MAG: MtrB/PioB family decaheme-associated outer membrane protein [Halieaceae bacterium]